MTDLLDRTADARHVADVTLAAELLDAAGPVRYLLADKGYDVNSLH